jgi:hypothetical protein
MQVRIDDEVEFGTQHGRAEIHDHDDAVAIIGRGTGLR